MIIATEIDLRITEDQLATIPAAFTVIGDHPEWLSRGAILDIARATEGWTARDVASDATWPIAAAPDAGYAAVTASAERRMSCVLFLRDDHAPMRRMGVG